MLLHTCNAKQFFRVVFSEQSRTKYWQLFFRTFEIFISTIDNIYTLFFVVRNVIYHIIVIAGKITSCRWGYRYVRDLPSPVVSIDIAFDFS